MGNEVSNHRASSPSLTAETDSQRANMRMADQVHGFSQLTSSATSSAPRAGLIRPNCAIRSDSCWLGSGKSWTALFTARSANETQSQRKGKIETGSQQ